MHLSFGSEHREFRERLVVLFHSCSGEKGVKLYLMEVPYSPTLVCPLLKLDSSLFFTINYVLLMFSEHNGSLHDCFMYFFKECPIWSCHYGFPNKFRFQSKLEEISLSISLISGDSI